MSAKGPTKMRYSGGAVGRPDVQRRAGLVSAQVVRSGEVVLQRVLHRRGGRVCLSRRGSSRTCRRTSAGSSGCRRCRDRRARRRQVHAWTAVSARRRCRGRRHRGRSRRRCRRRRRRGWPGWSAAAWRAPAWSGQRSVGGRVVGAVTAPGTVGGPVTGAVAGGVAGTTGTVVGGRVATAVVVVVSSSRSRWTWMTTWSSSSVAGAHRVVVGAVDDHVGEDAEQRAEQHDGCRPRPTRQPVGAARSPRGRSTVPGLSGGAPPWPDVSSTAAAGDSGAGDAVGVLLVTGRQGRSAVSPQTSASGATGRRRWSASAHGSSRARVPARIGRRGARSAAGRVVGRRRRGAHRRWPSAEAATSRHRSGTPAIRAARRRRTGRSRRGRRRHRTPSCRIGARRRGQCTPRSTLTGRSPAVMMRW